jgi:hypothetical protein
VRDKNACPGCRGDEAGKPKTRVNCRIKKCEKMVEGIGFCFGCDVFPCDRLDHLDERYRGKYGMSMIKGLTCTLPSGSREKAPLENISIIDCLTSIS